MEILEQAADDGGRDPAKRSLGAILGSLGIRRGASRSSAPVIAARSSVGEAVLGVDDSGIVRFCSPGAETLFRAPAASLTGRPLSGLIPRLRFNGATPGLNRFLATFWSAHRGWLRLEGLSPRRGSFQLDAALASVRVGAARLLMVSLRDVEASGPSSSAAQRATAAVAGSDDAVMLVDAQGTIEYVNPGFERITGFRAEEAHGRTPRILKSGTHPPELFAELWATLRAGREFRGTLVNRRKDGSVYHEEKSIRPLFDGGGAPTHYLSVGRDVTERVNETARLERLAHYDELTGVANRNLFADRLHQAIARAARYQTGFALLYLDLDDFKTLNDQYGHACGDAALREVARRLLGCLREEDTVARIGGDEFAILLAGAGDAEAVAGPLEKIGAALRGALALGECVAFVGASIGVSLYPLHGRDGDALMGSADAAMYRAKGRGGGHVIASAGALAERAA
jgi:diguanylate cyclase (GGDEF)-like protein/PAS domain S-box-containing protein